MSKNSFQWGVSFRRASKTLIVLLGLLYISVPQAQAQSVLVNNLSATTDFTTTMITNLSASSTLSPNRNMNVTSLVLQLGTTVSGSITVMLSNTTLTIGGTAMTYSSYNTSTRRATFTGDIDFTSGVNQSIIIACACGSGSYEILRSNDDASNSNFDYGGSNSVFQLSLTGTITNAAPVLSNISDQTHRQNDSTVSVSTGATDADSGDTLTYSASGLPAGLSISSSTGTISGTPTTAQTVTTTVSVSDGTDTDSDTFSWTITANNAPVLSAIGDQSGTIGSAVSISPTASDADSDSVTWSATGLPAGLSINSGTGVISGTPTTNNAYSTTVTINDGFGGSDDESFTFTIANSAPVLAAIGDQSSTVGTAVSVSPSASDTNSDTISWSATGLPTGLSINSSTGAITGTPSAAGSYSTSVSISDGNGGSDSESLTWTVVVGNAAPVLTPIEDRSATVDVAVSFTPAASDANGDTISYAATGLPSGLSINAGSGAITGTPSALGIYAVTITVTDPDSASDTQSFDWTISEAAVAAGSDDDDTPSRPNANAQVVTMTDTSTREMFDITRQSLIPAIRMATQIGLSRLAELRDNPNNSRHNHSSHDVRLAFNDVGLQQAVDGGLGALANDYFNNVSEHIMPEGMAVWSRGQWLNGSLRTASNDMKVDVHGRNLTLGVDYRLNREITMGGFYQMAESETETASQNAEAELQTGLFMTYLSFVPRKDIYLQGGLGIGALEFDIERTVNGDLYRGTRDGDKMHWLLSASQIFEFPDFEMTVALDAAYQSISLDGYRESGGTATYQYLPQDMRTYYAGWSLRFAETYETDVGRLSLSGELGYQADMSDDTIADAFLLADPDTVYRYVMDADDKNQSLSHSTMTLEMMLETETGWMLNSGFEFFSYRNGSLSGVNLSASRRF